MWKICEARSTVRGYQAVARFSGRFQGTKEATSNYLFTEGVYAFLPPAPNVFYRDCCGHKKIQALLVALSWKA